MNIVRITLSTDLLPLGVPLATTWRSDFIYGQKCIEKRPDAIVPASEMMHFDFPSSAKMFSRACITSSAVLHLNGLNCRNLQSASMITKICL